MTRPERTASPAAHPRDAGADPSGLPADALLVRRPHWQRVLWGGAGALALGAGIVGIFLPLLPTTPLVLLAAFCLSRSSVRAEAWLLNHPRFGPMVRNWRRNRAIPLRAKQLAWVMMTLTSVWAWWAMPPLWRWLPGLICLAVGVWMARLPSR